MRRHIHHIHIYILLGCLAVIALLTLANFLLEQTFLNQRVSFGLSYSPRYSREIGLDPKLNFLDILNNLQAKSIRLNASWDEIEPKQDVFNFSDLDWYISESEKYDAQVILSIGYKLPRWPECEAPEWLNPTDLHYLRERQLIMLKAVITHYEKNPTILAWQLENEPLLNFGVCPPPDPVFFQKELHLVRGLTNKPILITDSGELRSWIEPMQSGDFFGTTLYRKVRNPVIGDLFYPLPPSFYRVKSEIVRKFFAPSNKETIVAELQAELWAGKDLSEIPLEEQLKKFPLKQFQNNVEYARRTGFKSFYLWGAEWWYYLAERGHPEYLEYAKTLF